VVALFMQPLWSMDIRKAFDIVNHYKLLDTMTEINSLTYLLTYLPKSVLSLLAEWYYKD